MVVARLIEQFLPKTEHRGSNPVQIGESILNISWQLAAQEILNKNAPNLKLHYLQTKKSNIYITRCKQLDKSKLKTTTATKNTHNIIIAINNNSFNNCNISNLIFSNNNTYNIYNKTNFTDTIKNKKNSYYNAIKISLI